MGSWSCGGRETDSFHASMRATRCERKAFEAKDIGGRTRETHPLDAQDGHASKSSALRIKEDVVDESLRWTSEDVQVMFLVTREE